MLRGRCMGTPSILASFVICLAANNLSAAAEVDPMQSAVSDNFAAGPRERVKKGLEVQEGQPTCRKSVKRTSGK